MWTATHTTSPKLATVAKIHVKLIEQVKKAVPLELFVLTALIYLSCYLVLLDPHKAISICMTVQLIPIVQLTIHGQPSKQLVIQLASCHQLVLALVGHHHRRQLVGQWL